MLVGVLPSIFNTGRVGITDNRMGIIEWVALAAGSITAFTYAFQLSQLPVGIIGVSIAVALFPTLSRDAALGRASEIRRQVNASIRVLFFVPTT